MKRLIAAVLVIALMLTMCVSVFAQEISVEGLNIYLDIPGYTAVSDAPKVQTSDLNFNKKAAVKNESEENIFESLTEDQRNNLMLFNFIFGICLTVGVYSLPIIIYRFVIRRKPVEKKKAKKITLIYGFFSLLLMISILFFWGMTDFPGQLSFYGA